MTLDDIRLKYSFLVSWSTKVYINYIDEEGASCSACFPSEDFFNRKNPKEDIPALDRAEIALVKHDSYSPSDLVITLPDLSKSIAFYLELNKVFTQRIKTMENTFNRFSNMMESILKVTSGSEKSYFDTVNYELFIEDMQKLKLMKSSTWLNPLIKEKKYKVYYFTVLVYRSEYKFIDELYNALTGEIYDGETSLEEIENFSEELSEYWKRKAAKPKRYEYYRNVFESAIHSEEPEPVLEYFDMSFKDEEETLDDICDTATLWEKYSLQIIEDVLEVFHEKWDVTEIYWITPSYREAVDKYEKTFDSEYHCALVQKEQSLIGEVNYTILQQHRFAKLGEKDGGKYGKKC